MKYLALLGMYVGMLGAKYALVKRYPDASHELPLVLMSLGLMVFAGVVVWLSFA